MRGGQMQKILISNGNSKIGNDTFILNITSATDCSSKALGLCSLCGVCYAMKAEVQYPAVLPYRQAQEVQWDQMPVDVMSNLILGKASRKKKPIKYLRLQESGDFRNQEDIDKMSKLADQLKGKIKCYVYTARKDLDFSNVSTNLTVNGSGFMVHNNFVAVNELTSKFTCKGNCRQCNLCKENNNLTIQVKIH